MFTKQEVSLACGPTEPESMTVAQLNRSVRVLREENYQLRLKVQAYEKFLNETEDAWGLVKKSL